MSSGRGMSMYGSAIAGNREVFRMEGTVLNGRKNSNKIKKLLEFMLPEHNEVKVI